MVSPPSLPIATPTPPPIPSEPEVNVAAYKAKVIRLINDYRGSKGCPAAVPNAQLATGAQAWTEHLVVTLAYQHSPMAYYNQFGYTEATGRQQPVEVIEIGGGIPAEAVQSESITARTSSCCAGAA